jgi:AAA-like domain
MEWPAAGYDYQVGGSLRQDALTYVARQADQDLYVGLRAGELCYVLNSRQMGKSSLRVRTMARLQAEGVACVDIQVTDILEAEMTPEQWYAGVINSIVMGLGLADRFDDAQWWQELARLSAVQRFSKFMDEVLLRVVPQAIVIFIDEIDRILSLNFNVDGFFAVIRECYNKRSDHPDYRRLTFALIGVATPSDLIRDQRSTPFNIGRAIDLRGFELAEAMPLAQGLGGKVERPEAVLAEILAWTGGQPFLTQKLCQLVRHEPDGMVAGQEVERVGALVQRRVIDNWESQDEPEHLRTIRDRLLMNQQRTVRILGLYQKLLQSEKIATDSSLEQIDLQMSGLAIEYQGHLKIYSRIYALVFSNDVVEQLLQDLRPYAKALAGWISSNRATSWLLRDQELQDSLAWAKNKSLSDQDYQFLSASQLLDKRDTEVALVLQKEINQI